jgi:hypothetical protein
MTTTCLTYRQPFTYPATPGKPVRARCPMCSAARPIVARRERVEPGEAVLWERMTRDVVRVALVRCEIAIRAGVG